MRTSFDHAELAPLVAPLRAANLAFAARYPGEAAGRQPVHTVYGGAHLFRADSVAKLGQVALRALEEYAPDADTLARAVGIGTDAPRPFGPDSEAPESLAQLVHARVVEKLRREPVEDFRLDFEDGYGVRPDGEEDAHASSAGGDVAAAMRSEALPPFIGLRVKPLSEEFRDRAVRTLDLFVTSIVDQAGGIPTGLIATLPKVTVPEQVTYFVDVLERLERALGLASGAIRFEIMIETPQSIIGRDGRSALPSFIDAARGRLWGAHFGTYDYTAGCNITAHYQRMRHAACDFARHMMQVAFAGTGAWLSDGSTTVMPVPVHRVPPGGAPLTERQLAENRDGVHRAWRLHYEDVRHSLAHGFYQGWDLHPAQLVSRYAALFVFFLEGRDAAADRLRNFVTKAAQATLVGDVFDDAATGQGLLNYFLRGINSGAMSEAEVVATTGVTLDELRGRSFVTILRNRQGRR